MFLVGKKKKSVFFWEKNSESFTEPTKDIPTYLCWETGSVLPMAYLSSSLYTLDTA